MYCNITQSKITCVIYVVSIVVACTYNAVEPLNNMCYIYSFTSLLHVHNTVEPLNNKTGLGLNVLSTIEKLSSLQKLKV